jgi:hypothetical protein
LVSSGKGRDAEYVWGLDMSSQSLWNLAKGPDMAETLDMSGLGAGHIRGMPLESGLEVGHIQLPKPDSLICKIGYSGFDRQRIKMDLRKAWGPDRNKRDIDIIHIGLYHLENGILDIAMSF